MDSGSDKLVLAAYLIAGSMVLVIGIFLIKKAREGDPLGALTGLAAFLAGITYGINKWVGYTFLGLALLMIALMIYKISKE